MKISQQDAQSFYQVAGSRGRQMMEALVKRENDNPHRADILTQLTTSGPKEQNADWQMPGYHPHRVIRGAHSMNDYGTW